MAGRSFTRHSSGVGNRIKAEHINELQVALEEDDVRLDAIPDVVEAKLSEAPTVVAAAEAAVTDVAPGVISPLVPPLVADALAADDTPAQAAALAAAQAVTDEIAGRSLLEGPTVVAPVLVLSPGGSEDADGPVAPVVSGSATTAAGTYGNAWVYSGINDARVYVPNSGYINTDDMTVIIRASFDAPLTAASQSQFVLYTTGGTVSRRIRRFYNGGVIMQFGAGNSNTTYLNSEVGAVPDDTFVTLAMTCKDGTLTAYIDGVKIGTTSYTTGGTPPTTINTTINTTSSHIVPFQTESHLFFATALSDDEVAALSAKAGAHTLSDVVYSPTVTIPTARAIVAPTAGGASELELRAANDTPGVLSIAADGSLLVNGVEVQGGAGTIDDATLQAAVVTEVDRALLGGAQIEPSDLYLAQDRFVDTNGTALTAHAPDIGTVWTASDASVVIEDNAIKAILNTNSVNVLSNATASDVRVSVSFTCGTSGSIGVVFRSTDPDNNWFVTYDVGNSRMAFYQTVAGARVEKGSSFSPLALTPGESYTFVVTTHNKRVIGEIAGKFSIARDILEETDTRVGVRLPEAWRNFTIHNLTARRFTPRLPQLPTVTATPAASYLNLPAVYGDEQGTHPAVVDMGSAWNGYRYWMAWTPYNNSDTQKENPCIAGSNDKVTWETPTGLTNPVVAPLPHPAFHSDPDLVFANGTMYLMYRTDDDGTMGRSYLSVTESTDGVTWSTPQIVSDSNTDWQASPAVVYRNGVWHMWAMRGGSSTDNSLHHRTAQSIYGPWSDVQACSMPKPGPTKDYWHLDVLDIGERYAMVISSLDRSVGGAGAAGDLYYAESFDGIWWEVEPTPFLVHNHAAWNSNKLYRSTFTVTDTGYDLWYSGNGTGTGWHVAYTHMDVITP